MCLRQISVPNTTAAQRKSGKVFTRCVTEWTCTTVDFYRNVQDEDASRDSFILLLFLILSVCRYNNSALSLSGPVLVDLVHCLTKIMAGSGDLPGEYFLNFKSQCFGLGLFFLVWAKPLVSIKGSLKAANDSRASDNSVLPTS